MKSIDLLLIAPDLPESSWLNSISAGVTPPLGLAYIGSYLLKNNISVKIIDFNIHQLSANQLIKTITSFSPHYVGISINTTTFNRSLEIAKQIKHSNPNIIIIAGGPHPSALPQTTLKFSEFDFVITGEGEHTFLELIRNLKNQQSFNHIKGLTYRKNKKIISNHQTILFKDLDHIPMPAYHLLEMDKYHPSLSRKLTDGNFASIITSRGCPHQCSFCSNAVFGNTVRYRSPDNVINEIKHLIDNYNIKELIFWDDTFTSNYEHAKEIALGISQLTSKLSWSCYSRVDLDPRLLKLFNQAGCKEILFGIESGNQSILNSNAKKIKLQQITTIIELCKKYNISSFCSVILGLPGETEETAKQTLDFLLKLNPDYAAFCILIPFPGSEIFNKALKENKINLNNCQWNEFVTIFSTKKPPISFCQVSPERLVFFQKKFFRLFYFRFSYILSRMKKIDSLRIIRQLSKGLITLIKHQIYYKY